LTNPTGSTGGIVASTSLSDGQIPYSLAWIPKSQTSFPGSSVARGVVSDDTISTSARDGDQVYTLVKPRPNSQSSTDGAAFVLSFGVVDTRIFTATKVSVDIFLVTTGWDSDDFVNIYLIVDGDQANPVTIFSYADEVLEDIEGNWLAVEKTLHYSTSSVQLVVEFSGSVDDEVMYVDDILVGPVDQVPCTPELRQDFDTEALRVFGYRYDDVPSGSVFDLPNAARKRLVDSTRDSDCLIGYSLFLNGGADMDLRECSNCRGVVKDPTLDDVDEHSYAMSYSSPAYLELRFDDVTTNSEAIKVQLDLTVEGEVEDDEWINVYAIVDDDEVNVVTLLNRDGSWMNNNLPLSGGWHTQELALNFNTSSVRLVVEMQCNQYERLYVDNIAIDTEATPTSCSYNGIYSQDFNTEAARTVFGYGLASLDGLTGPAPYRLPNMARSTLVHSTEISASNCQLGYSLWWDPQTNTALGSCEDCRGVVAIPSGQAYVMARPYNKQAGEAMATFELRFDSINATGKAVDISLRIYLYSQADTWESDDRARVFVVIDGNRDDPYVLFDITGGNRRFRNLDNQWLTLTETIEFQTSTVELVVELTSSHDLERIYVDNVVIDTTKPTQTVCGDGNYYQNFERIRPSSELHSFSMDSTTSDPVALPNEADGPTLSAPSSDCLLGFDLFWNSEGAATQLNSAQRGVVREDLSSSHGDNVFSMAESRDGSTGASLVLQFANVTTEWSATQISVDLYILSRDSEFWENPDYVTVTVAYVDGSDNLQETTLFTKTGDQIRSQGYEDRWTFISGTISTYTSSVQLFVEVSSSVVEEILYVDGVSIASTSIAVTS